MRILMGFLPAAAKRCFRNERSLLRQFPDERIFCSLLREDAVYFVRESVPLQFGQRPSGEGSIRIREFAVPSDRP